MNIWTIVSFGMAQQHNLAGASSSQRVQLLAKIVTVIEVVIHGYTVL